jgi:hypothetical protein
MDEADFWHLHKMLHTNLGYSVKPTRTSTKKNRNGAPNGLIHSAIRLSIALRFFAGGSAYDIALVHGVSYVEVYRSVWRVVDAVNQCAELCIQFPSDHQAQKDIAQGFQRKSSAKFDCCVGAVDGILIWTEKPRPDDCKRTKCGPKKFLCGRKKKFGLNMQAVCDSERRFLDVAICHPGSTSDFLAFSTSPLKTKLEQPGFLAPKLCLFGDNAYVNTFYMATPFKGVSGGTKDDYNFYHSQVRITIECAFGMLVHRWGILRKAIPSGMGLAKITALVMCLCRLHNYCINRRLERKLSIAAEVPLAQDFAHILAHGGIPLERTANNQLSPDQLLGGGEHFEDQSRTARRGLERFTTNQPCGDEILPRDKLHHIVVEKLLQRPRPCQN